jgi:hypothetical protein
MGELARKLHELDGVSSRVEQLLRQDFPVLAPTASSCFIIMYIQIVVGSGPVPIKSLGLPSLHSTVVRAISEGLTPSSDSTDPTRFFLRCAFAFPSRRSFEPDLEASSALLIAVARS